MSLLDMHRSQLRRKKDEVVKDMRDIAGISDKISRKQAEAGRTKSPSQQQRVARDLQRLADDRARAEKSLAVHQRQASELSKKVANEEEAERKKILSEQRKRDRQQVRSPQNSLPHVSTSLVATAEILGMMGPKTDPGHNEQAPTSAFIAYSHEDKRYLTKLHQHLSLLRNEGKLDDWHDRRIDPGQEWEQAIDNRLYNDKIILLLVSPGFMASKYCWEKEMKVAMQRHEAGEATVIPIIVRDCDWESAPFGKLEALPEKGRPITRWSPQDSGWRNVAKGIRKVIESLSEERGISAPPATAPAPTPSAGHSANQTNERLLAELKVANDLARRTAEERAREAREAKQAILEILPGEGDRHAGLWVYHVPDQYHADVRYRVRNNGRVAARDITSQVTIGENQPIFVSGPAMIRPYFDEELHFILPLPRPFPGGAGSSVPENYPDSPVIKIKLTFIDDQRDLGRQETVERCFRFSRVMDGAKWISHSVEPCPEALADRKRS